MTHTNQRAAVGSRIQYKLAIGTIRYIGPLHHQSPSTSTSTTCNESDDVYVGIEWDDASRGKHSGTHSGTHYFTTSIPGSGSFIKVSSQALSFGIPLSSALLQRRADAESKAHRAATVTGNKQWELELRDANYFRDHTAGTDSDTVDVSHMCVCHVDARAIRDAALFTHLSSLSINANLLTDISDVLLLLSTFPLLRTLDVSRNMFTSMSAQITLPDHNHGLQQLIMNNCSLPIGWSRVLAPVAPTLTELRLHNCGLTCVGDHDTPVHFPQLLLLDLDANALDWTHVLDAAKRMPRLRTLHVSRNGLPDSRLPPGSLPALRSLGVGGNAVKQLAFIYALPLLTELRAGGNPVADNDPRFRLRVIGRLAHLRVLDGSVIEPDERLHAERFYLRSEILPHITTDAKDVREQLQDMEQKQKRKEKEDGGDGGYVYPRAVELYDKFKDSDIVMGRIEGMKRQTASEMGVVTARFMTGCDVQVDRKQVVRVLPLATNRHRLCALARVLLRMQNCELDVRVGTVNLDDEGMTLGDGVSGGATTENMVEVIVSRRREQFIQQ